MKNKSNPTILIDRNEVALRIGVSTSTLDRLRKEGGFPKPRQIGKAAIRWDAAAIDEWIESREVCAFFSDSIRFKISRDLQADEHEDDRPPG